MKAVVAVDSQYVAAKQFVNQVLSKTRYWAAATNERDDLTVVGVRRLHMESVAFAGPMISPGRTFSSAAKYEINYSTAFQAQVATV
jgi:hypothetical protein